MNYFYINRNKFCKEHDCASFERLLKFYEDNFGYENKNYWYTIADLIEKLNINIIFYKEGKYIKCDDLNKLLFILKNKFKFKELDTNDL